jgi:hypothetical protein
MKSRRWVWRLVVDSLRKCGLTVASPSRIDFLKAGLADREAALSELQRRLSAASALPLPVYITDDFRPVAQMARGASPHRIIICSIPKAGTYLVDRLLELLGCVPSRLHLSSTYLTDYRFATLREARERYERLITAVPLDRAVALHLPGQFSVGHLECNTWTRRVLADVKKVFVYRDLRDGLVSFLRFLAATGRGGETTKRWKDLPAGPEQMLRFLDANGQVYFDMALPMLDWLEQPDVFFVRFETLYGDIGEEAQQELIYRLHAFLSLSGTLSDLSALRNSLFGAPTMTWSGERAAREPYWNEAVEQRFVQFGGREANRRLGYETFPFAHVADTAFGRAA